MAQALSDESLQLKKRARRRLVGAAVLVTLVIIFLPMVLDKQPKPVGQDIAITIPSQDSAGDFNTKPAPTASAPMPNPEPPLVAPKTEVPPVEPPQPAAVELTRAKPVEKKPDPAEAPKATRPEKPTVHAATTKHEATAKNGEEFVIQLGAFTSAANVKQLQSKLSADGIKSYTEPLKTAAGNKTRVRAGPYATRQEAEKVRDKLQALGLSGAVVPRQLNKP